jgi:hypothetical protein
MFHGPLMDAVAVEVDQKNVVGVVPTAHGPPSCLQPRRHAHPPGGTPRKGKIGLMTFNKPLLLGLMAILKKDFNWFGG